MVVSSFRLRSCVCVGGESKNPSQSYQPNLAAMVSVPEVASVYLFDRLSATRVCEGPAPSRVVWQHDRLHLPDECVLRAVGRVLEVEWPPEEQEVGPSSSLPRIFRTTDVRPINALSRERLDRLLFIGLADGSAHAIEGNLKPLIDTRTDDRGASYALSFYRVSGGLVPYELVAPADDTSSLTTVVLDLVPGLSRDNLVRLVRRRDTADRVVFGVEVRHPVRV